MSYLGTKPQTATEVADGVVTPSDLSTGHPNWDTSGNVGIGTSSPGAKLGVSDGTVTLITSPYAAGLTGYFGTSTNHPLVLLTNSSERMRIDSSGRVTIPYQPAFYANVVSGGTVATSTVIPFNQTNVNVGSCFNTSTYRFTAPVAGTYLFIATPSFNNASTARVSIRKNGSQYFTYQGEGTTSGWLTAPIQAIMTLAVNDYVDIANVGGSSLAYDGSLWMGFSGHLIG